MELILGGREQRGGRVNRLENGRRRLVEKEQRPVQ